MRKAWFLLLFPCSLLAVGSDIQVRGGCFRFSNHTAREIYGQWAPDVELQGDLFVHPLFNPWININYVWKKGRSDPLEDKTDLKLGTVSVGSNLRLSCCRSRMQLYLGIGATAAFLRLHDHSAYLPRHTRRWGIGAVGKSGLIFLLHRHLLLDLFFDYYYQPMHARSSLPESSVDVGGFRTGAGLGYIF